MDTPISSQAHPPIALAIPERARTVTQAVIMAGGKGTRLYPYSALLPKPLMPLGDMPILELLLRRMRRAGITDVILAVNHLVDSSLLTFPYSGAVLACATLACYYGTAVVNRRNFYPGFVRSPARLSAGPRSG